MAGAADRSLRTALQVEKCKVLGIASSGGVNDIYKCFDQVIRHLVYELLRKGGMPAKVVDTYARFHEGLEAHNTIAGCVGVGYNRRCRIPQGCPLSMLIMAFMMGP